MGRLVIGDVPRIHARRAPRDVAYIDGARRLTWADVDDRVTRLGHGLAVELGLGPGDRIAVLAGNGHEHAEIMFAGSRIAAISTGLNTRHHPSEMVRQLEDADASLLIIGPGHHEHGGDVAGRLGIPTLRLGDGPGGYEDLLASASTEPIAPHGDEDLPYALTYTSGTTGEPKGAIITSRNEVVYAQSLSWAAETRVDDRFMVVTPMFHKGGQFSTMHPAVLGLPAVIMPGPEPTAMFAAIEEYGVTVFVAVPTIMKFLIDAFEVADPRPDLTSLRHVLYGSNPIPAPMLRRFSELFSCSLSQIGGTGTEGGVALVLDRVEHAEALAVPAQTHRLASCGRVQPGFEVTVVDDDDREVPVGEPGELVFRGDAFTPGYWRRPEASTRLWRNGWLHSGDIGRIDEDGFVYYLDRKAGRIKTGGETVYAREVEVVLRGHPGVADVAVVGVADAQWGEAVWAAVELVGGLHPGDPRRHEEEIRTAARRSLAGYKVPKRVVFVEALPRTALGKVAIGEVRALLAAEAEPADVPA